MELVVPEVQLEFLVPSDRQSVKRRTEEGGWGVKRGKKEMSESIANRENQNLLVWIDLEMSGLDLTRDFILEIACIITTGQLEVLGKSEEIIIHHPQSLLDGMNDWCKQTHSKSGLTQQVLESVVSMEEAEDRILSFIKQYVPSKGTAVMAGNSIHVDKQFLPKDMPSIPAYLHYRLVDVSTVKELCARWYPDVFQQAPAKGASHRALKDIEESIQELAFYRQHIMK